MKEIELSRHPTKGYRLSLSYYITPEGKRSPKVWWLGQARRQAEDQADVIRYGYRELVEANGLTDWTPEAIEKTKIAIERTRRGQEDYLRASVNRVTQAGLTVIETQKATPEGKQVIAPVDPVDQTGKTLYQAIKAYL